MQGAASNMSAGVIDSATTAGTIHDSLRERHVDGGGAGGTAGCQNAPTQQPGLTQAQAQTQSQYAPRNALVCFMQANPMLSHSGPSAGTAATHAPRMVHNYHPPGIPQPVSLPHSLRFFPNNSGIYVSAPHAPGQLLAVSLGVALSFASYPDSLPDSVGAIVSHQHMPVSSSDHTDPSAAPSPSFVNPALLNHNGYHPHHPHALAPHPSDLWEARLDSFIRLHTVSKGFSDVTALAIKVLAHLALGWQSRFDMYLESTGVFEKIKNSSTMTARKRVSSEMLQPATGVSSGISSSPIEDDSLPRSSGLRNSNNGTTQVLMRSLSEASVISTDSTQSVSTSFSALSTSPTSLPKSNFSAPATSPLFYNSYEFSELKGTSIETLGAPPTFDNYFAAALPILTAVHEAIFIPYSSSPDVAHHLFFPMQSVTPPLNHPSRSRVDPAVLLNLSAFRAAIGLVLSRGVRVCPPINRYTGGGGRRSNQHAPWTCRGGVIGNLEATLACGYKRRLQGQPFEFCGCRGGGCGLLGLEEVFGRVAISRGFHEGVSGVSGGTSSSGLGAGTQDTNGAIVDADGGSRLPDGSAEFAGNWYNDLDEDDDEVELFTRRAWGRRTGMPSAGFVALVPFVDMLDRKTRTVEHEYEEELRSWKLHQQQQFREQGQAGVFQQQQQQPIPSRTDFSVEFTPPSAWIVPSHPTGEDAIRLESHDLEGMNGLPPGYNLVHVRSQFHLNALNAVYPMQRWTMLTGNLSNHHLLLSYGTIEDKNLNEILDIPIDLIEDAITSHLEHFGPATSVFPLNMHSSNSPFNIDVDLAARFRTARERTRRSQKGKQKARYDVYTYEQARALLKAIGVFPGSSGVIRCKSEYFWQDETLNTIIQVLLMSPEQFAEYSMEPCMLDYNSIAFAPPPDTPSSSKSDSESDLAPRSNIIPSNYTRRRGRLPFRDGAHEAFLAVTCSILQRRLKMYPTTYQEDQQLLMRINETAEKDAAAWAAQQQFAAQQQQQHQQSHQPILVKVSSAESLLAGGDTGEHEDKRRRKSVNASEPTERGAPNNLDDEILGVNTEEATLKVARSDDTLVSVSNSLNEGSDFSLAQQLDPDSSTTAPSTGSLQERVQKGSSFPLEAMRQSLRTPPSIPLRPLHANSQQSQPQYNQQRKLTSPVPHEWFSNNRVMAIKFRMCEKKQLHQNLKFLETLIEKRNAVFLHTNSMNQGGVPAERSAKDAIAAAIMAKNKYGGEIGVGGLGKGTGGDKEDFINVDDVISDFSECDSYTSEDYEDM
ncbi:hypothetical protein BC830DRAFT_1097267 [Chytriomyces sp. MP71]|nr:hypothetical protein BC830DRAFT_1097267 [Chytriomyces sp. MP71]